MDSLTSLWLEGYKARAEATKQGALISTVLIAVLAFEKNLEWEGIWAFIFLTLAVALSAFAHLAGGHALTKWARRESKKEKRGESPIATLSSKEKGRKGFSEPNELLWWANIAGTFEIVFLILGFVFTCLAVISE